jgi:hypothetical protein
MHGAVQQSNTSLPDSEDSDLGKIARRKGKRRSYEEGGLFPLSVTGRDSTRAVTTIN